MQGQLFSDLPIPPVIGWSVTARNPGTKRPSRWEHSEFPGLAVCRTGHYTALRPFYVTDGDRMSSGTYARLEDAQAKLIRIAHE